MLRTIAASPPERFCALVIGPAGVGKTSLLRTIPAGEKACVISAEAGLLCVQDLVRAGQIEGFEVETFSDMAEAYQLLATNEEMKARYRWVFIDSLSEIASRCVEAMKAKYSKKDAFQMWGEYTDALTGLIKGFRDLQSYSVVFTCLEGVDKDEASGARVPVPIISGSSLQQRLTSYFDLVCWYEFVPGPDGSMQRRLITQPYGRWQGKDRSGRLDATELPDLGAIKKKILGG